MEKIRIGIIGATGIVGQNYISLLENHPWFEVSYVAASKDSAGKTYGEAVKGKWKMERDVPKGIEGLVVGDANEPGSACCNCDFIFSALEIEKDKTKTLENVYAGLGFPVVSNASANRWEKDIPMIIPEINHNHIDLINVQRQNRNWRTGFIVTKPNCSIQSYITPVYALMKAGYSVDRISVTTMQAVSGAGTNGVPSLDIIDNVIPFISGEEEKTEREPLRILGELNRFTNEIDVREDIKISATCTRVPVINGHLACVSLGFSGKRPGLSEVKAIWNNFRALPQELQLPSAPRRPIVYREEENRPQPRRDRDEGNGMTVTLGRLRNCNLLDIKFVGLSHNTVRGAAGGAILTAELLKARGYL